MVNLGQRSPRGANEASLVLQAARDAITGPVLCVNNAQGKASDVNGRATNAPTDGCNNVIAQIEWCKHLALRVVPVDYRRAPTSQVRHACGNCSCAQGGNLL
jgi:hypothetical protein